jgi:uncharacterized protein with HEPN domain
MAREPSDDAHLWDMLDAAQAVMQFVRGKAFDDYLGDRMLRGAVERHVEIIGEAARNVSLDFQNAHPEIPWRSIIAQRHVLAHDYGEIKHDRFWRVATEHIPALVSVLGPLVLRSEHEDDPIGS